METSNTAAYTDPATLQGEIDRLSALASERLDTITSLRAQLSVIRSHIVDDGNLISDEAIAIAEKHGFCEVWDNFYEELNGRLRVIELKERVQTHKFRVRIKSIHYLYHDVEVTAAGGRAKVRDMLADDPDSYMDADDVVREAIRKGEETDWDYDIEVVED